MELKKSARARYSVVWTNPVPIMRTDFLDSESPHSDKSITPSIFEEVLRFIDRELSISVDVPANKDVK